MRPGVVRNAGKVDLVEGEDGEVELQAGSEKQVRSRPEIEL